MPGRGVRRDGGEGDVVEGRPALAEPWFEAMKMEIYTPAEITAPKCLLSRLCAGDQSRR